MGAVQGHDKTGTAASLPQGEHRLELPGPPCGSRDEKKIAEGKGERWQEIRSLVTLFELQLKAFLKSDLPLDFLASR